ncbi:hypothetical protein [Streptomyces sp. NPDC055912]|uniref:hypothetical protein n=1 Tax=Streptomyces sp. NPDC055912 TaxID=3345660 RepID=UPI0035E0EC60
MAHVHKITSLDETWQPGDVVLAADGTLRVRPAHVRWVWDDPGSGSTPSADGGPHVPEDHEVPRPLILLVRNGQSVGGRAIAE